MKVLLVNKFHYMKGGSEKYYFTMAELFKKHNWDVVFFAMQDEKNVPCDQSSYFVSNASVKGGIRSKLNMVLHIAYSKEAYSKMKQLLEKEKPDLVILNLVHKQITCSVIDAIKEYNPKLPIFWTCHDLIFVCPAYTMLNGKGEICEECMDGNFNHCRQNKCIHGSTLMSYLSTYEAKQIRKHGWYDKVDAFICPSEFYKEKLVKSGFTKSKIVCLRNPLPENSFSYEKPTEDGYFLFFGRLSKEKGVDVLIDAIKDSPYRLVIAGTGPIEEKLKESAKDCSNISFVGFKQGEELQNIINGAKAVILPSQWYENGPYSAMEAMAKGKPLIVSRFGGLPELVKDGINGYSFDTIEELKKCLVEMNDLYGDDYASMCKASYEMAKEEFDGDKYFDSMMKRMGEINK